MKKSILIALLMIAVVPFIFLVGCGGNNSDNNSDLRELPEQPAYVASFERQVFDLTNTERVNYGLTPFLWHDVLSRVSRDHSIDMARGNFMSHTGSDGTSARQRMENAGLNVANGVTGWSENVARGQRTPEAVVTAWMNSTGHRANILNENRTHLGVGFAYFSGDSMPTYWTQKFITLN